MGRRRWRLDLGYDGTDFRGFADNDGVRTVGGELNTALTRIAGHPVAVTCAGRTDAGVHARGQVVHADLDASRIDPDRLRRSLNHLLGPEIAVRAVSPVPDDFDARFSAIGRSYRYRVVAGSWLDPQLARYVWHLEAPLDLAPMVDAASAFVGEHDFASFCRRPKMEPGQPERSLVRRVRSFSVHEVGRPEPVDGLGRPDEAAEVGLHDEAAERDTAHDVAEGDGVVEFRVSANAFCHQQVRSMVGLLTDIGRGRRSSSEVPEALAARDRAMGGTVAPARGLTLWAVEYPASSEWVGHPVTGDRGIE